MNKIIYVYFYKYFTHTKLKRDYYEVFFLFCLKMTEQYWSGIAARGSQTFV